MLRKHQMKSAILCAFAGLLLWLGLAPRCSGWVYEEVLMPREPRDTRLLTVANDPRVQFVWFKCAPLRSLPGILYRNHSAKKIILFFAGRSSNLSKCTVQAREMLDLGVSVFTFEYRGFGNTPGRPSVKTLMNDGLAAYTAVIELGFKPEDIVIYGESLGSAVAAHVSARHPAAALVLQSGFSSFERLAKELVPLLRLYPSCMYAQLRLASDLTLKEGHPPLLVIHGDEDELIDLEHARRLAAAGGAQTTVAVLKGAQHSQVYEREDWHQAMRNFLDSL